MEINFLDRTKSAPFEVNIVVDLIISVRKPKILHVKI